MVPAFQGEAGVMQIRGRKETVPAWSDQTASNSSGEPSMGFKQRHKIGINIF